MPQHVHHFRLRWSLLVGLPDVDGWAPVVVAVQCACGQGAVYGAEENTRLQQRRMHEGARHG